MMPAAKALGADYGVVAMAIAWGDAWTNMVQPFWALPLLAVAKLNIRDIMGYTTVILLWSGVVTSLSCSSSFKAHEPIAIIVSSLLRVTTSKGAQERNIQNYGGKTNRNRRRSRGKNTRGRHRHDRRFYWVRHADGLITALVDAGTDNLTLVANDTAMYNPKTGAINGLAPLVVNRRFSRMIVSHIGTNAETQRQLNAGETQVDLVPQGTLAERIRCGGTGLGGVLTPTGLGTEVQEGKSVITVAGREYLLEEALAGDVALIKAKKADKAGNLVYSKSARNFNPLMATACKTVIVEAEEIVEIGRLDPEEVVTPSIFVTVLVRANG